MALLGNTAKPTSSQEWWGSGSHNQHAVILTFPPGGPWKVTTLGCWMAGKDAAVTTYLTIWSGPGTLIGYTSAFSAAGRSFGLGQSDSYEAPITSPAGQPVVAGGASVYVGFSRNPSGAAQFGRYSSGAHDDDTADPYPANLVGNVSDFGGALSAWLYYELANQLPNAPTLTGPADAATVADTTPTLTFTHSDPNSDPCSSYDIQVDAVAGYGVAPDWSSLAWEVVNGTSGISGNNITRDVGSALTRGQWYGWRARTADAVGDGAWSATRWFKINRLPTVSSPDPGASDLAFVHNLGDLALWTAGGSHAKPRLKFTYTDPDGHACTRRIIRIYTAASGGSPAHTDDANVSIASGSVVTIDANYAMPNGDQGSSERWWTVEVYDSAGESSGELNPATGAGGSRAAFRVLWAQGLYEHNPGASSSAWSWANAAVAGNTQAAFAFRSATSSGGDGASGKSAFFASIGQVPIQAWAQVLVRLATQASGIQPALPNMTFSYIGASTTPDRWVLSPAAEWTLDESIRRYGRKSLKCAVQSGTVGDRTAYPYRKTSGDDIPVVPLTTYTASIFVRTNAPLTGGSVRLEVWSGGGVALLAASASTTDTSPYPDGQQRLTVTYTTDAGTNLIRLIARYTRTSGVTETFWIDAAAHVEGTVAIGWTPGAIGKAIILDVNGLQIDALEGGIFRARGSLGGTRDTWELGPHALLLGGDVELYSPVADIAQFDDQVRASRGSGTDLAFSGKRTADSNPRWTIDADGTINIYASPGDANPVLRIRNNAGVATVELGVGGGTAVDLALTRLAANVAKLASGDRLVSDLPGAIVLRTATQTITHNAYAAIDFTATDVSDQFGFHDPASNSTRITVPAGFQNGLFLGFGVVEWDGNATGRRILGFGINGADPALPSRSDEIGLNATAFQHQCFGRFNLGAGDYVELKVYQDSGVNRTISANAQALVYYLGVQG